MKVLASHKFKNDKSLEVRYLNRTDQRKLGVLEPDVLSLTRIDDGTEHSTYIRPDEAVILIQLLAEAVYKSVKGYEIGLR